jgi:OOP family OmpA-OmpF porin
MTNKKWIAAMLGAAAMAMSAGALAQKSETGWYVGGMIGQADLDIDEDTAWKFSAGYQINRTFAVELGYTSLADFSVLGTDVEASAWEVIGVGKLPVANQFSVYGLLGIAFTEAEVEGFGKDDSTELTFGVGAQYDFSPKLGLRAQWQRYGADEDIDVMSVGIVYKF